MTKRLSEAFPPPEELVELEPEEIAVFLLDFLCGLDEMRRGQLNRRNFTSESNLADYPSDKRKKIAEVLMEAWIWLEREGMIAPKPGETGDWIFITRRGFRLRDKANLEAYKKGYFLPKENLDEVLVRKVFPLFIRGDYDTAIFQAFKEVEIRVRRKAKLSNSFYGVDLIKEAFRPQDGLLTDKKAVPSERNALFNLFMGSIGYFKNPPSHRDINPDSPGEAVEIIFFANYLLRLVGNCRLKRST